jgi:hypothetical protein
VSADETRHSRANEAQLISDSNELAKQKAQNGLRQFDAVIEIVEHHLTPDRPFPFGPLRFFISTVLR